MVAAPASSYRAAQLVACEHSEPISELSPRALGLATVFGGPACARPFTHMTGGEVASQGVVDGIAGGGGASQHAAVSVMGIRSAWIQADLYML